MTRSHLRCILAFTTVLTTAAVTNADDRFEKLLKPALATHCVRCHGGGDEVEGDVDLHALQAAKSLLSKPELLERVLEAVDSRVMPPEGERQPDEALRTKMVTALQSMLVEATAGQRVARVRTRRLNRFQYNNAVRDLFRLRTNVFPLPEKLMTRFDGHLRQGATRVPDRVQVGCLSLDPEPGLDGVVAFPKDARAGHGFDNQADQLTLSPLLLDSFLRLAVSIVESPDFKPENVGLWNDFFTEPEDVSRGAVSSRLREFLELAFRRPVDDAVLRRYTDFTMAKLESGTPYPNAMKKVASAVLSSPRFLLRTSSENGEESEYELAEDLSFLLWGSGPDRELLDLAEQGRLSDPDVLGRQFDRMVADPRIERFLDTFPAQWMQLSGVLAATPDPAQSRLFFLDRTRPASTHMVLEPLLLFEATFVENRPIVELLKPTFTYRSEFLRDWYESELKPAPVDGAAVAEHNRENETKRVALAERISSTREQLAALESPVRQRLLAAKQANPEAAKPVDLKPYAAWEFDGTLESSVGELDLTPSGAVRFEDGYVLLEKKTYLQSEKLPIDLRAKSLEVWCQLSDLDQRGGGLMGIQGPGGLFDTIVIGERKPRHWISGSNNFARTTDFPDSTPETDIDEPLHFVMTYAEDGTTTLYRNGEPYGRPYKKGSVTFPRERSSVLFGLRHLPAGGNKHLTVSIDKARLYDRTLTADEARASFAGNSAYVTEQELVAALPKELRVKREELIGEVSSAQAELAKVPADVDPKKFRQDVQRRFEDTVRAKLRSRTFERVAIEDPRYGGVITNAAMLSMTSGPKRTHPIARGAWIVEVILNDPPPPPPNNVPPLKEESDVNLTIRERFARHRENPSCAGCHAKLDPLGFALENFDIVGRWRDDYRNGRPVDASGRLLGRHEFGDVVAFKSALVEEERRFAKAFTRHLLRYALARELVPADAITVDAILREREDERFRLRSLLKAVVLSEAFRRPQKAGPPEHSRGRDD